MQHDLRYHELARPSSKYPTDEPSPALYWWCICGNYQSQSMKLDHRTMVESFLGHLTKVGHL